MPRTHRLLLALVLFLVPPVPASAWSWGDTLTVIWKPLPNLPSIVRPGDVLTVWANAPFDSRGWSAALRLGTLRVPLVRVSGSWESPRGRWELGFAVPGGLPEALYDLLLIRNHKLVAEGDCSKAYMLQP